MQDDKNNKLRQMAEKIIREKGIKSSLEYSNDLEKIVQELNIYQIELEHQNKELLQTQEELQRAKSKYFDLYENAPTGYLTLNTEEKIISINATTSKILGNDKVAILGTSFTKYIHPDSQDTFYFHLQRVKKNGQDECQVKITQHDVAKHFKLTSVFGKLDDTYRITLTDITKIIELQNNVAKEKEFWEKTFANTTEGVFLMREDYTIFQCNDAFAEIIGLPLNEIVGKKSFEIMHGLKIPPDYCVTCRAKNIKQSTQGDYWEPHLNKHLKVNADPVYDANGNFDFLIHYIEDITASKKAELQIIASRERAQMRSKLSHVFLSEASDKVFAKALRIILQHFKAEFGYFGYINENGDLVSASLTVDIWDKCKIPDKDIVFPQSNWNGLWGKSLKNKKSYYQNSGLKLPDGHVQIKNALAVPILSGKKLIGQIVIGNKKENFTHQDQQKLEFICAYVAPILHNKLIAEKLDKEKTAVLQSLKESEERYRLLSDVTFEGIIIHKNGIVKNVNESFIKMTQYARDEIIGQNIFKFITDKNDIARVKEQVKKEVTEPYVITIQRKDKTTFFAEIEARNYTFNNERLRIGAVRDVTEKIKAEKALKSSEEKLSNVINHSQQVFFIHNTDNVLEYISPQCKKVFGFTEDEMKTNWTKLITNNPLNSYAIAKTVEAIQTGKKQETYLLEHKHKCKKRGVWVEVDESPLKNDAGEVIGIVGSLTDVTDRIIAQRKQRAVYNIAKFASDTTDLQSYLEKVHNELSKLINARNFYVAILEKEQKYKFPYHIDEHDKIEYFNQVLDLKGSLTDYTMKNNKPILVNKKVDAELKAENKIELLGEPAAVWLGAPFADSNKKPIGIVAVQDYEDENAYTKEDLQLLDFVARNIGSHIVKINTQKTLEENFENLKIAKKIAEENELQFRQLFENMEQGFALHEMIYDDKGNPVDYRYVMINAAFERLTNAKSDEYIGKTVKELLPGTEKHWIDNFGNVAKTGKPMHFERYAKELKKYYHVIAYSPLKDYFATVVTDVTKNKMFEKELIQAKEKAEESDRLKSAFLSNMSHEIRTPMNSILGFSSLLNRNGITEEKRDKYVKIIQNNSEDLLRIINDILDISKLEAKQIHINKSEVTLHELLKEVIEMQKQNILDKQKPIDLIANMEQYPKEAILTDAARLKQVLNNIMDNAIKFTDQGFVELDCQIAENEILFKVKDTGIGMAPEQINSIFERFIQIGESMTRKQGGNGLGLAICKGIIELLGGEIWVESKENIGTTFYFNIPFEKAITTNQPFEDKKDTNHQSFDNKNVLIVEDDAGNAELLKTYLEPTGIKIYLARNGKEAIEAYENNKDIDIILMDINLPDISGLDVTREIKKKNANIPIISQTAFAMQNEREKFLKAGCDDYISKPINNLLLIEKLNHYLYKK